MKNKILFGTGGIPDTVKKRSSESGIKEIRNLGLDAMELEFVRGVRMGETKARKLRKIAKEQRVTLTVHGPYYINLASKDKAIREKSLERILKAARIGNVAGAKSVTFHASYFQDQDKEDVFLIVKQAIQEIINILESEGIDIAISPELTGKRSQWGSLEELVRLSKELRRQVKLCFDFAHQHARDGRHNSYDEFIKDIEYIEKHLGKEYLQDLHMHVSGINYSEKGERNHLMLEDSDFKYRELLKALKDKEVGGIIICESPIPHEDALLLKKTYESLE